MTTLLALLQSFLLLLSLRTLQPLRSRLQNPQATYWDGSTLWIPDTGNAAIRAVLPAQQVGGFLDWEALHIGHVGTPRGIVLLARHTVHIPKRVSTCGMQ